MEQQRISNHNNLSEQVSHLIDTIKDCIGNSLLPELKKIVDFSQSEQRVIVSDFQKALLSSLEMRIKDVLWKKEYKFSDYKDSIDVFGENSCYDIIIELDKPRADQVAKKMLSRMANFYHKPIIYFALCYPGTSKMNPNECIKYFKYGKSLAEKINDKSLLVGGIIDNKLNVIYYE